MMKVIKLSRDIYSDENIKLAKEAYKSLAKITVSTDLQYVKLRFLKCKYEETRTIKEFENYLIGLENS